MIQVQYKGQWSTCCGRRKYLIEHGEKHRHPFAAHAPTCPLRPCVPEHSEFATEKKSKGFLAPGARFRVAGASPRAVCGTWEVRAHTRKYTDRHGYFLGREKRDVIVVRKVLRDGTLSLSAKAQRHFRVADIRILIAQGLFEMRA